MEVFGIRKARSDGLNPQCKPCVNVNRRKRSTLPAVKEKQRIYDARNRADPVWRANNKKYRSTVEFKAKTNARAAVPPLELQPADLKLLLEQNVPWEDPEFRKSAMSGLATPLGRPIASITVVNMFKCEACVVLVCSGEPFITGF